MCRRKRRWQGYENDHGGVKKLMWNHEGVQLQGYIHVVQALKGKRNGLHAQTTRRQVAGMEGAAGLHHWAQVEVRRSLHNDVKFWDSWDQYPIYARIQEDEIAKFFLR